MLRERESKIREKEKQYEIKREIKSTQRERKRDIFFISISFDFF